MQVLFALHEKGVSFRQYEVNVVDGEQFSDWFLELNAKAELPLLKSGSLIIPGGAQIINYAEKNFVGGTLINIHGSYVTLTCRIEFFQVPFESSYPCPGTRRVCCTYFR